MPALLDAIAVHAAARPRSPALAGATFQLDYAGLSDAVTVAATHLVGRCLGILADNGPAWLVADLAAQERRLPCVPLPPFFTAEQLRHAIDDAGIDLVLTDRPERIATLLPEARQQPLTLAGQPFALFRLPATARPAVAAAKITYTSGTTGTPKGVLLGEEMLYAVASSLATATRASHTDRLLSLLPLAVLLENVAVYAALISGACTVLPPLGEALAAGGDPLHLAAQLRRVQPTVLVTVPQLLEQFVRAAESGARMPASLRFVAVGGAPVTAGLLARAAATGLPAYQGYGLSEACSVVTLNRPEANRPGSVGHPLPHAEVRVGADGEIEVRGALSPGYIGSPAPRGDGWLATGDVGRLDADGYLYVDGRRDHRYATAAGRNVSPEWPEQLLQEEPGISQAIVIGDARPCNVALLVVQPGTPTRRVDEAVTRANSRLPSYARVDRYLLADEPFSPANGLLTGNLRPRRAAILERYQQRLDALYMENAS